MSGVILEEIKNQLGLEPEETNFDTEIMIHINSVLMVLQQLGFPAFFATKETMWDEYLDYSKNTQAIKSYMFLKVKLIFDPPTGSVLSAYQDQISEFEWRLNVQVEGSG